MVFDILHFTFFVKIQGAPPRSVDTARSALNATIVAGIRKGKVFAAKVLVKVFAKEVAEVFAKVLANIQKTVNE